jgi:hypothetical protein
VHCKTSSGCSQYSRQRPIFWARPSFIDFAKIYQPHATTGLAEILANTPIWRRPSNKKAAHRPAMRGF